MRKIILTLAGMIGLLFSLWGQEFVRISTVETSSGFPASSVNVVTEDAKGRLLAATPQGVVRLINGKWEKVEIPLVNSEGQPIESASIIAIYIDKAGNEWYGSGEYGLARCSASGEWKLFNAANDFGDFVPAICETKEGIWVVNDNFVSLIKADGTVVPEQVSNNPFVVYYDIVADPSENILYLAGDSEILQRKEGEWSEFSHTFGENIILKNAKDLTFCDGVLYIGGALGLCTYDGTDFKRYTEADGLPIDYITAVAHDKAGNLWVGTGGEGVAVKKEGVWVPFSTANGLSHNDILALYGASDGCMYVATDGGALPYYTPGGEWKLYSSNGLRSNSVNDVCYYGGDLWVATKQGLSIRKSGGQWNNPNPQGEPSHVITRRLAPASSPEGMWIAYADGAIAHVAPSSSGLVWTMIPQTEMGVNAKIQLMSDVAQVGEELLVATYGAGLAIRKGNNWRLLTEADGLVANSLFALVPMDTKVWICSVDGWQSYEAGMLGESHKLPRPPFETGNVRHLTFSSQGDLYICGNDGLHVQPREGEAINLVAKGTDNPDYIQRVVLDKGENVWVATWDKGLYLYDQQYGLRLVKFGTETKNPQILSMRFAKEQNQLLMATDDGVWYLQDPEQLAKKILAVETPAEQTMARLYPKPVADMVHLRGEAGKVEVYSLQGELLAHEEHCMAFSVADLSMGQYIVLVDGTPEVLVVQR